MLGVVLAALLWPLGISPIDGPHVAILPIIERHAPRSSSNRAGRRFDEHWARRLNKGR